MSNDMRVNIKFDNIDDFIDYAVENKVRSVFRDPGLVYTSVNVTSRTTVKFPLRHSTVPDGWRVSTKNNLYVNRATKRDVVKILRELSIPDEQVKAFTATKLEKSSEIGDNWLDKNVHEVLLREIEKGFEFEFPYLWTIKTNSKFDKSVVLKDPMPLRLIVKAVLEHGHRPIYEIQRPWAPVLDAVRDELDKVLQLREIKVYRGTISPDHIHIGDDDE
jgi:hypothetical protein